MRVKSFWAGLLSLVLLFAGLVALPVQANATETSVDVKVKPLASVSESDYGNYSVWLWYSGEDGKSVPLHVGADGELQAAFSIPEGATNAGMLVRRAQDGNEWAHQSQDVTLEVGKNLQVSVVETEQSKNWQIDVTEQAAPSPEPGENPDPSSYTAELTVHYVRYTGNYDGWNIWTWLPNQDGQSVALTEGTATWSVESDQPITRVGVILRRSTPDNEWAEKNTSDDLFITDFKDGKAEVWIAQGDPNVYYSQEDVPATPDLSCHELHSKEFNDKYFYDGELGALYTPDSTTFRLWAPTAASVGLVNYSNSGEVLPMTKGERGTWEYIFEGDANMMEYRYRIEFEDGKVDESPDPYARSSTANSTRSVVIDVANVNPQGWNGARMKPFSGIEDATIYETHVRDMTIAPNNGISNKGKFLGLTETGTKTEKGNVSGLDYIKSLGVTHVQFLPMYDFYTVDETGDLGYDKQYNWGYDPVNYNVPEGSYASDPTDPASRVRDMKAMIDAVHDAGMYVVMDVVYNHVYDTELSPLQRTVPGYYFRYTDGCALQNGTGVGNETASEQPMMRKYMIDSLKFWAQEYSIDGFRFDLMGIHDVETMNEIRSELNKIDESIVMLGEGWNMGNHPEGVKGANQDNAKLMPGISFFNDKFRDTMKGTHNTQAGTGYVSGGGADNVAWDVFNLIKGANHVRNYADASQSVNYNEAHDNLTMYDKLRGSLPGASEEDIVRRHAFATQIQFLSNGANFVHAGQEALRTKGGEENSYKSPDSVNAFDYDRAADFEDSVAYFRELANFRAENSWVRLVDYSKIEQAYEGVSIKDGDKRFSYKVTLADQPERIVFVNPTDADWNVTLPDGNWKLLLSGLNDAPMARMSDGDTSFSGDVAIGRVSAVVFEKAPDKPAETEPTTETEATTETEVTTTGTEVPADNDKPTVTQSPNGSQVPSVTSQPTYSHGRGESKPLAKTGAEAGLLAFFALALAGAGVLAMQTSRRH